MFNILIIVKSIDKLKEEEIINKCKIENINFEVIESGKIKKDLSIAEFTPEYVFSLKDSGVRNFIDINGKRLFFKVGSNRIKTFKKNLKCVNCGIEGKVFSLEKTCERDCNYHLNLYAIQDDGTYILMTKDHITPRSQKGSDRLDNLQTMCVICNNLKGNNKNINFKEEDRLKFLNSRKQDNNIKKFKFSFDINQNEKDEIDLKKQFILSLFNNTNYIKEFYFDSLNNSYQRFSELNDVEIIKEINDLSELENEENNYLISSLHDYKYFKLADKENKCICCGLEINNFSICRYKNNNVKFRCCNKVGDKYVLFYLDYKTKNKKIKNKVYLPFYNCSLCHFIKAGREISKENFSKVLEFYHANKNDNKVFNRCAKLIDNLNNSNNNNNKIKIK